MALGDNRGEGAWGAGVGSGLYGGGKGEKGETGKEGRGVRVGTN